MTTRILIADGCLLFRQGLISLFCSRDGWSVVGQAGDGEEAVRLAGALTPDLALVDLEVPGMGGAETARGIRRASAGTRVVALSMYRDAYHQERMLRAGAFAYVLKTEPFDALVATMRAILRNEAVPRPVIASRDVALRWQSALLDSERLSARERAVLRLLAEGRATKEIGQTLGVNAKTVETYRRRMMGKLGIDNVPGLVRFAIRADIIPLE